MVLNCFVIFKMFQKLSKGGWASVDLGLLCIFVVVTDDELFPQFCEDRGELLLKHVVGRACVSATNPHYL